MYSVGYRARNWTGEINYWFWTNMMSNRKRTFIFLRQYSYVLYLPTRVMVICPCFSINSRSHRTGKIWLSGLFTRKEKLITSVFWRHRSICDFETIIDWVRLNKWFLYYTLRFQITSLVRIYLFYTSPCALFVNTIL